MGGVTGYEQLLSLSQGKATVGELICLMAGDSWMDAIYLRDALDAAAETLSAVDDSHFTVSGDTRHFEAALPGSESGSIKLDVTLDGSRAKELTGSVLYDENGTKLDCTFSFNPMRAALHGVCETLGYVQAEFDLTASCEAAPGVAVPTAPPAGAAIADLFEAVYGGIIGGADGPTEIIF